MLLTQSHPTVGVVQTLGPVVKLSRTPAEPRLPPPTLGEQTDEVIRSLG
jgi:crotonobetainyl-CoA:carnitine CoA-transferase CaiB-like acyl-CoA transferase